MAGAVQTHQVQVIGGIGFFTSLKTVVVIIHLIHANKAHARTFLQQFIYIFIIPQQIHQLCLFRCGHCQ